MQQDADPNIKPSIFFLIEDEEDGMDDHIDLGSNTPKTEVSLPHSVFLSSES